MDLTIVIKRFLINLSSNIFVFLFLSLFVSVLPSLVKADSLYYIHQDHLSSTNTVTNQDGEVVSQQSYYPYGSTRLTTGGLSRTSQGDRPTERQYTSQISDQDQTGLYYYNARYYDPRVALFSQADSLSDGLNRYAYVGGNPISFSDPSGNIAEVGSGGSLEELLEDNVDGTYYPQGFSGCSTGPGWAKPGNCGPPSHPEVSWEPTLVLVAVPIALSVPALLANPAAVKTAFIISIASDVIDVSVNAAQGNYADAALALASPVPGAGLGDDIAALGDVFARAHNGLYIGDNVLVSEVDMLANVEKSFFDNGYTRVPVPEGLGGHVHNASKTFSFKNDLAIAWHEQKHMFDGIDFQASIDRGEGPDWLVARAVKYPVYDDTMPFSRKNRTIRGEMSANEYAINAARMTGVTTSGLGSIAITYLQDLLSHF